MSRPLSAAFEYLRPSLVSSDPDTELAAAKCYGLLVAYDQRWSDAPYVIDAVECITSSALYNPVTTRKSRNFTLAGKLDVIARDRDTNEKVLIDHKTASQDITDPGGTYWQQLVVEAQPSFYFLLQWLHGRKPDYALWDVIRKPLIQPRLLSKSEIAIVHGSKIYCDFALDSIEIERFEATGRETPLMFAGRLAIDAQMRPDWYFQRRKVPRLDSEIFEHARDVWDIAQDMAMAKKLDRHPKNPGFCFNYQTPCRYLGICSKYDTVDSHKWYQAKWVHDELVPILGSDGREILTNSRIRLFQNCRQKEYFQYQLGLRRVDEEKSDALFFGAMMHSSLEQFFLALREEQTKAPVSVPIPDSNSEVIQ